MGNRILKANNFMKTVRYLRRNGILHTYYAARERIGEERSADYFYREPSAETLREQRAEAAAYSTVFSVVVPAYETDGTFLREMVESVRRQSYGKWELIIVDGSGTDAVEKCMGRITADWADERIRYIRLSQNQGISVNTNAGIAQAAGDYIALLDHDDLLAPDALYHMAAAVERAKKRGCAPVMLYSDEDKYDSNTRYYTAPNRKTEFNLDFILANNYICHLMAVEARALKRLQLRGDFDGAQDYDLVLRLVGELWERVPAGEMADRIVHIPQILYHWRCHADSTADNTSSKAYAYEAGRAALADFCAARGWQVQVRHSRHLGFYDILYRPDILTVRRDVGIVGGRILDRQRRICGGAMGNDGSVMYCGLHREYSGGSTHRAALKQDTAAVDIRCMQVREEMREAYEQITGLAYAERMIRCGRGRNARRVGIADVSGLTCDEAGYRKLSLELGKAAAERGYRVLWDPQLEIRTDM